MMKRILGAGAALAALAAASAAFAVTPGAGTGAAQESILDVTGHVDAACSINTNTNTVDVGSLSNPTTGVLQYNGPTTINVGPAWCNGANSSAVLSATPLSTTGTPTGIFSNRIDYVVQGTVGSATLGVDTVHAASATSTTSTVSTPTGAFSSSNVQGTVSSIRMNGGATSPLAGNYTATLTLTLTPGI